eukprot:4401860-Amphidinium_carterae.1
MFDCKFTEGKGTDRFGKRCGFDGEYQGLCCSRHSGEGMVLNWRFAILLRSIALDRQVSWSRSRMDSARGHCSSTSVSSVS